MFKTHLVIGATVAFYFFPYVKEKVFFIPIVLLASILPDIDSGFSYIGRGGASKVVQWMTNHRGIIHTYTLCILLSLFLAFFYPVTAFPFFLGYSFHLFADSFTVRGIKPFWPLKFESKGIVKTGGRLERIVFIVFVLIALIFLIRLFISG